MIIQLAPKGVVAHKYLEIYLFARNEFLSSYNNDKRETVTT